VADIVKTILDVAHNAELPDHELTLGEKAAAQTGYAAGIAVERERVRALLTLPEVEGRLKLAIFIAINHPDMPLEEASAMLAASAAEPGPPPDDRTTRSNFYH
jgi:hypothetical protein